MTPIVGEQFLGVNGGFRFRPMDCTEVETVKDGKIPVIKLVRSRVDPSRFISDKLIDQERLSAIGYGVKPITEKNMDDVLEAASVNGYILETPAD